MFTSCNVNEDMQEVTDQAVRFSGNIERQADPLLGSRAAGAVWGNDAIGVFMVENGTTAISENAANRKYTATAGSTAFTADAGNEIYYPTDGSVDFIAYYPYAGDVTLDNTIKVVIGEQDNQPAFDLLYAKADNGGAGYTKTKDAVALSFDHQLAKIVMNCKTDASVGAADLDNMTVTISGMNTENTFDLTTGTLGTATAERDVTPRKITTADGFGASYDAIVMPGDYGEDKITVAFAIGEETFIWNVSAEHATFEGGNEYIYTVTITRMGIDVSARINPWTIEERNGLTAK